MSKELLLKTLRHEACDRLPWVPFTGVHAGRLKGYTATEMLTDSDKLVEALKEVNRLYKPDGMPVMFDLQIEAEILGCELVWAAEAPPSVKTHPLSDSDAIPCDCTIPQKTDGRLPIALAAMRRLKEEVGHETALYGLVCGPFTLASHLRGNNIFMDMYDDEDYVDELLEYAVKVCKAVAGYYIEAGMDIIAFVDPLVSQVSPLSFKRFLTKPFTDLFDFVRGASVFSSFFVCGNATANIEPMCETGPDCIAVDENVNMVSAKAVTDKYNITLSGNIPLTTVMLLGNQQDNMKYVVEELVDKLGHNNLIISPGCDMPYATPVENTIAAAQAAHEPDSVREMIKNYESTLLNGIDITLPDYAGLKKPLIEVCTLDSDTCAACTYMLGAAVDAKAAFGDSIDVVEYKFTVKENVARFVKMGVKQLPSIYINGELKYSSIIPNKEELAADIRAALEQTR